MPLWLLPILRTLLGLYGTEKAMQLTGVVAKKLLGGAVEKGVSGLAERGAGKAVTGMLEKAAASAPKALGKFIPETSGALMRGTLGTLGSVSNMALGGMLGFGAADYLLPDPEPQPEVNNRALEEALRQLTGGSML